MFKETVVIRMDIFVSLLRGRALWLFELISVFFILVLILMFDMGSIPFLIDPLIAQDHFAEIVQLISLPIWPSKLVVPFCIYCLHFDELQAIGYSKALYVGSRQPMGTINSECFGAGKT